MSSKSWRLHILHILTVKLLPIEWNVHIAITVISSHWNSRSVKWLQCQSQYNTCVAVQIHRLRVFQGTLNIKHESSNVQFLIMLLAGWKSVVSFHTLLMINTFYFYFLEWTTRWLTVNAVFLVQWQTPWTVHFVCKMHS